MKAAVKICRNVLDLNIVSFDAIDAGYVAEYNIYRQSDQINVYHTRLIATLVNEISTPFPLCTVTVNEMTKNNRVYKAVSGITDINGNVIIREFEGGLRTITISGDTIQTPNYRPHKIRKRKSRNTNLHLQTKICKPGCTGTHR